MKITSSRLFFIAVLFVSSALNAQIIFVKTYPVLSDNSVLEVPSANAGLGHVAFALRDKFAEPFRNPAFITDAKGITLFMLPRWSGWNLSQTGGTMYTHSGFNFSTQQSASNTQVSIGVLSADDTDGIAVVTGYQRLRSSLTDGTSSSIPFSSSFAADQHPVLVSLGFSIAENFNIGVLYNFLPLKGIDGIQFLYPNSKSVHVSGSMSEYRFGISASFASSSLDVVGGRNMYAASHGAVYEFGSPVENRDENDNIFAQALFTQRMSDRFSLSAAATANWKELPKLPNYPIAGFPRDPGYTRAFNAGGGLTYLLNLSTLFVLEYLYEPIGADTWVDALETRTVGTRTIVKGERERENNYDFHNYIVRLGLQMQPEEWLTLQIGSEIHSYSYDYEMKDFVGNISRRSSPENEWTEATLTGGAIGTYGSVKIMYTMEFITGRGMLEQSSIFILSSSRALSNDFFIVPGNFLRVNPVNVTSHRLTMMYML